MAAVPDDLFFRPLSEISARLRDREFTAPDLVRASCDRLETLGPRYHAVALVLRQDALRQADKVNGDIKRGRFRGLLQGVPYGVKDLLSVAGRPTTWGARPYAAQVFDESATLVRKLEKTGALLTAKLAMIELAGGGGYRYASASLTGACRNPWDPSRWAGGSSSGPAAAVAAGLVPFAIGSETSGSIVTPCAFCGVTGLRPTYGLVSRAGAMALSWTMDKLGPIARSAEDCGQVLQVIAGGDSADPGSARKSYYFYPQSTPAFRDVRVAYSPLDFEEYADEPLRPPLREALGVVRRMQFQIKESKLPDLPYGPVASTVINAEAASAFSGLIGSGQVDQLSDARQIAGLRVAAEISAVDYLRASRLRRKIQQELARFFSDMDLIVAPARYSVAPPVEEPLDRPSGSVGGRNASGFRNLISAGNLAGLPALVLPCGFANGLPVALMLVGRPFNENLLISVGIAFQKLTDWHRRRPGT
jgi:aspartyl-tRNA(Asn)/glutamyl-tRNA(Gln) amidotransferase subunit A